MSKRNLLIVGGAILAIALPVYFFKFWKTETKIEKINPAFANYISAYTSGVISSESPIRVLLANETNQAIEINEPIEKELFDFSPDIKGEAYWIDNRTIEFRPENRLPSKVLYKAEFYLHKVVEDVPNDLETFNFDFQTMQQSFEVYVDGLKTYNKYDLTKQKLLGSLITADIADNENIEKLLSASQENKQLPIKWEHEGDGRTSRFIIDSISRKETAREVILKWNGKAIDVDLEGTKTVEVPALGDFKLVDAKVVQTPEQYVLLQFSDPLEEKQNLNGLVSLENVNNLRFIIEENEIRVYPPSRQTGSKTVKAEEGIRNIQGYKMKNAASISVLFEEVKPAVKLSGKGVILPNSNGLVFPFEAVSLRAVDVKIIKIFENNIAQFLQVNQLDGNREMKRVGRQVLKKTIRLDAGGQVDFGKWNAFSLDLAQLIQTEPGAIYKVIISFKKEYSVYNCPGETISKELEIINESSDAADDVTDNYYDDYYYDDYYYDDYYYEEDYDYSQRENPCHTSYYRSSRDVSRNVLASDLGIIAKRGNNGSMMFAVTDLRTTNPLPGITLELYNYQQQKISQLTTNSDGMALVDLKNKPFLLIAKNDEQRGYLKLDDGSSLSLSTFDVSGETVQKGIKGFIYGERGVWRPGDSLFVMFLLEDKEMKLPKTHPVTFELINPQGQTVSKATRTSSIKGFYNFSTATDQDAPTGNWSAKVKVGGASFSKTLKIETIMPNRLKINIDFGKERLSVDDKDANGKLEAKWLHGAIAKNLKADVAVTLSPSKTTFKKFEKFNFDDPARSFSSEAQTIFEGRINEEGKASFKPTINIDNAAPGVLKASFTVRVFEEGGNFSIDRFNMPYYPYKTFIGIKMPEAESRSGMLITDTSYSVKVVTLDADGKPVQKDKLIVEVYKVKWQWWWDRDNNLSNYVGSSYHKPLYKSEISTNQLGMGEYKMKIKYPEWGRFLVRITDPNGGHATGQTVYMDWPGWVKRDQSNNPGGAAMLMFTADKEKYNVGETVKLTIPTTEEGRALVSVESGSKVIKSYWVQSQKGETVFSFPVTEEMAPNVFVNITLLQPHSQTKNDLPIRLYGVIPILIEDPNTHLRPVIKMPEVLVPEEEVSITVSEENGKEMGYTIAIVDEGLLDLTRFKTPDPWPAFYAREALGVKTWDLYDLVMGAFGGELQRILSIGGDDEINNKGGKKANRFKPMVKFLGPFELKKGEKQTHTFTMPQYIGSVRTMVIAANNGAYGANDKTTPVRKPLMILGTLPRVLGPGESVKLPVTVFAMEKNVKNVTVEVLPNNMLTLEGDKKKTLTFNEVGDEVVNFDLKVASTLGIGKVKIIARSGSEKAEFDIELDVRNPNPKVVNVVEAIVEPGQTWAAPYSPPGMKGTNKGTLEVSNIPPINLGRRLKYLTDYPHGCVEQTTSGAFPQLFLGDIMELDNAMKAKISDNIKYGINRLKSFQVSNGGLSYWPGHSEADDWGTTYAGHFMLEAEIKGYSLPIGFKENWKKFQKQQALNWSPKTKQGYYYNDDLMQAYRLYTLALAKAPELGAMNRLRENKNISANAKWRLAAAYSLAGQPEVAKKLIENTSTTVKDYRELSYTYGSTERDRAMIVETLSLMGERAKAAPLVKEISAALSNERWMSTQATAYSLIAISKFAGKSGTSADMAFAYKLNGTSPVVVSTKAAVSQIDMKLKGANDGNVEVKNNGTTVLYARVILEGIPETGDQSSAESNLKMNIFYKDMNGNSIDPEKLEQGTDFIAEISLTNPGIMGHYKEMALTQIFPSGWEIHNSRMDGFEPAYAAAIPTYQDIRDDRVYTYFNINRNETKTFRIALNAAYLGDYYLPTVYCEAMYDNTINARKPGKWVKVIMPGGN